MHTIGPGGLRDYAEKLEPFINQIPDYALYMLDLSGRIISWNAGAQQLTGYTAPEIIGRHFSLYYPAEDVAADKPHRTLAHASRQGTYQEEGLRVRKDGTAFWAAVTITALRDNEGKLQGFAKLTRDITERKEHEEAVQAARKARYRALFENSHDAILLTRPQDGAVLAANPAACALFGYTEQQLLALHRDELLDQTEPRFLGAWTERTATGAVAAELTFRRQGGEQFEGRVASKLFLDESGQEVSCTTIHDITEHKRTEERLRESEERFRTLFDNMTEGFAFGEPILDEQGRPVSYRYLVVNEAFYVQTGIPRGIQGLPIRDYLPHLEQYWIDRYCAVALTGKPDRVDAYNADTQRHYDVYVFSPSPGKFAILFRDITEQKRAEEELKTFKFFSVHSSEGNLIVDSGGRIRYVNRRLCERLGYSQEEMLRLHFQDISPKSNTEITFWDVVERAKDGSMPPFESIRRRKDGSTYPVEVSTTALEVQGEWLIFVVSRDITERKRAEQALKDNERRLAMALEASGSSVWEMDVAAGTVRGDDRLFTMLGYAPDELATRDDWGSRMHRDDREAQSGELEEVIQGQRVRYRRDLRFRAKDGSWVWIASHIMAAEQDAQGRALRLIGSHTDITERKQAEQALKESEERFRLLYENAPLGIVQIDENGRITAANQQYAEIVGYSQEELTGFSRSDLTLPEERADVMEEVIALLSGKIDILSSERRLLRKDGSTIWGHETARILRDQQGNPQSGIVIVENISHRKQAEEALQQSEEKFRATFEHVPLGISESTVEGRFIDVNPKALEIHGYSKDEIVNLTITDVTYPGDVEATLSNLQKLAADEIDSYVMEKRLIRKDRSMVWVRVTTSHISIHGKPKYLVSAIEDITARKKVEEDLKRAMEASYHQANHDMLTGLANRAALTDRLAEALAYAKRDGHLVALHLLDLDRFKSINDTLGHQIGDLLLKEVAKRIKSHVRSTDVVARLGGDEFVVIQTHLAEPAAAGILAEKLVEALGHTYVLEGQQVHSGASIGIALFPNDTEDQEELMKHADLALYEAKHRGRFNHQFYRKELGIAFQQAQQVEQELMRALRGNEFCLHYLPQFDVKNGRMTGIEALLRWRHPTRGMLAAAAFIQDAERARLTPAIGEWSLHTACRQYKAWVDAGLAAPLTLNLSSLQLRDPRFLQMLKRILDETGLPAPMLQLEMRESVLWDPKFSKNLLNQLKESGLHLALDDFGAEMTALSSLDKFPLDAVKPGQRWVNRLSSHPREAALLAAIIGVAHNLNMTVCANGVETDDQFAAVTAQGCDSAQGYWLSSPLDAHEMKQRIDAELMH